MLPKVCFIVLNWNNFKDTKECVEYLQKLDYPNYQIVIVDNHSQDGSGRSLQQYFPQHTVILNSTNSGYSGGNNVGIEFSQQIRAEYTVIVNNDILVKNLAFLHQVIGYMSEHQVQIVGPKIVAEETQEEVSVYDQSPWMNKVYTLLFGKQLTSRHNPILLLGSFLVFDTQVFATIGKLNEDFFMYCEENELLIRANLAGISIGYFPKTTVHRKMGSDGYKYHKRRTYYMSRNKLYMFKLHSSGMNKVLLYITNFLSDLKKFTTHLAKRELGLAFSIVNGIYDALKNVHGIKPKYH